MNLRKKMIAGILAMAISVSSIPFPISFVNAQEICKDENEANVSINLETAETQDSEESLVETAEIQTEETCIEETSIEETYIEEICIQETGTEEALAEQENSDEIYIQETDIQETDTQVETLEGVLEGVYQFGDAPSADNEIITFSSDFDLEGIKAYLYQQILERNKYIDVKSYNISIDELKSIASALINDHSELYFVNYRVTYYRMDSIAIGIAFTYDETLDGAAFQKAKETALAQLKPEMSDLEKAIVLHDYLVVNCEYDNDNYLAETIPEVSYSAYGALVNHIAVCNGYALAYKYLLNQAGIDCYMVTSEKMNHAWNMIVLDGKYYQVDVTWDDPVWDVAGRAMHTYMFSSDSAFAKHSNWEVTSGIEVVDYKATDTTYDNAFWLNSRAPLVIADGNCYYISSKDRMIRKTTLSPSVDISKEGTDICEVGGWLVWGEKASRWTGTYSGLFYVNNRLFYNDMYSIYSIKTDGKNKVKEFTANTDNGYIYGSGLCHGEVIYTLHKEPVLSEKEVVLKADIDMELEKPEIIIAENISLDCDYLEIEKDGTYILTPTITPENATDTNIIWTTSDSTVAIVENGAVKAIGIGNCVIMASIGDKYAKCDVIVGAEAKTTVEISGIVIQDSTYNGMPVAYSGNAVITTTEGEIVTEPVKLEYIYNGTQADGTLYESVNPPVNAGEYKLTVKVSNENKSYKGSTEYLFCINKAVINIKVSDTAFDILELDYLPELYDYETDGLVQGDALIKAPEFSYKDENGKEINPDNINLYEEGSYYIVPSNADAGSNYTITYQEGVLTLIKDNTSQKTLNIKGLEPQTYTGKAVKPNVDVYSNYESKLLKPGTDYTIKYFNNLTADTLEESALGGTSKTGEDGDNGFTKQLAYVVITGKGNYTGTIYKNFHINPISISNTDEYGNDTLTTGFDLKYNEQLVVNNKKAQKIFSSLKYKKAMKAGIDYEIILTALDACDENKNILREGSIIDKGNSNPKIPAGYNGSFLMTITGKGNYTGTIIKNIYVADKTKLIKNAVITLGKNQKNIKNVTKEDLSEGITLTAGYYDTESGKYYDMTRKEADVNDIFTVNQNGKSLIYGQDYDIKYINNNAVGTATMIITGINEYVGSKHVSFKIKGTAFNAKNIMVSDNFLSEMLYTGDALTQNNVLIYPKNANSKEPLNYNTDYTISYKNNIKKGTATMTFTANPKSGYIGSFKKSFKIKAAEISDITEFTDIEIFKAANGNISLKSPVEYSKQGARLSEGITLVNNKSGDVLKEGIDYKISYKDNKQVTIGSLMSDDKKPYLLITGKGNYSGNIKIYFDICKKKLSLEDIDITAIELNSKSNYKYEPKLIIKDLSKSLKSGKDYIIAYENNTQENVVKYINDEADAKQPMAIVSIPAESPYILTDKDGNITDKISVPLRIYKKTLKKNELYVVIEDSVYTGEQLKPSGESVKVYIGGKEAVKLAMQDDERNEEILKKYGLTRLIQDTDYTIESYGENITAGMSSGSLKITGISKEYGGSVAIKFKILSKGIYGANKAAYRFVIVP